MKLNVLKYVFTQPMSEPHVVFSQSCTPQNNVLEHKYSTTVHSTTDFKGATSPKENSQNQLNNSTGHASLNRAPSLRARRELHLLKRIPPQSEAMSVLVGSLEFLKQNQKLVAFVRLSEGRSVNFFSQSSSFLHRYGSNGWTVDILFNVLHGQ